MSENIPVDPTEERSVSTDLSGSSSGSISGGSGIGTKGLGLNLNLSTSNKEHELEVSTTTTTTTKTQEEDVSNSDDKTQATEHSDANSDDGSGIKTPVVAQQSGDGDLRTPPLSGGRLNQPSHFSPDYHSNGNDDDDNNNNTKKLSSPSPDHDNDQENGHIRSPVNKSEHQLADSLKTRLSYAFLKMRKGWTDYSLDHLENLQARKEARQIIQDLADANRENRSRGSVVPVSVDVYSGPIPISTSDAPKLELAPPPLFQVNSVKANESSSETTKGSSSYTEQQAQAPTPASTPPKPSSSRDRDPNFAFKTPSRAHKRTNSDSQIRKLGTTPSTTPSRGASSSLAASPIQKPPHTPVHGYFYHSPTSDRKGKRKPDQLWQISQITSIAGDLAHSGPNRIPRDDNEEALASPTSRPEADAIESLMFLSSPGTKFRKASIRE